VGLAFLIAATGCSGPPVVRARPGLGEASPVVSGTPDASTPKVAASATPEAAASIAPTVAPSRTQGPPKPTFKTIAIHVNALRLEDRFYANQELATLS
jgi:hypothetical protein